MQNSITIYRADNTELATLVFDTGSYRRWQVMGEHAVFLQFQLPQVQNNLTEGFLEIPVGSYIIFKGIRYTLYNPSDFTKNGLRKYAYNLKMYSYQELLNDRIFINEPDNMQVFPRTARPEEFLLAVVRNMNKFDVDNWAGTEWTVGSCITSNVQQTIQFNGVSCMEALKLIAEAFKTEWEINNKVISLKKVEYNKNTPLKLWYSGQYGTDANGGGFVAGLGRGNFDESRPVHKLYVKGGNRNIDFSTYGAQTLLLPKSTTIRFDGTYFDDETGYDSSLAREYQTSADGQSLTRTGAAQVSRREAFIELTEAYPKYVGTVTGIKWFYGETEYPTYQQAVEAAIADNKDAGSVLCDIYDTTIPAGLDFSYMRIGGEQAIIVPQTGRLSGREIGILQSEESITGYIHSERRFKLETSADFSMFIPDDRLQVGDTYAVFGIDFYKATTGQQVYITNGEEDLLKEAVRYKYENEELRFTFTGTLDGIWVKRNYGQLDDKIVAGGYVNFYDPQFHASGTLIRISAIKEFLHEPERPEIELTNVAHNGGLRGELAQIPQQEVVINEQERQIKRLDNRRWRDLEELRSNLGDIFSEFSEAINPVAVQSMQYIAGNKTGQFRFVTALNNNTVAANAPTIHYDATTNIVTVAGNTIGTPAYIQHETLGITAIDGKSSSGENGTSVRPSSEYRQWQLPVYNSPVLDKSKFYWVYAKVARSGTAGQFVVETTARKFDEDPSYYYLVVGGLNSENESTRSFAPLFGFTEILPGQITTGMIRSSNGLNWINLSAGTLHFGNSNNYLEWNGSSLNLRGALVQSQSGANDYLGVFRGDWSSTTQYYAWDEVTYNGVTYRAITTSYGVRPQGNTSYWQPRDADPMILYRGDYSTSATYQGTRLERNVVRYGSQYYISNIVNTSFSGSEYTPINTNYWTLYGASFEMVATNLLLAQTAYIENLIVDRICSGIGDSLPRLKATGTNISFYNTKADENSLANAYLVMGNLGSQGTGISMSPTSGTTHARVSNTGIDVTTTGTNVVGIMGERLYTAILGGADNIPSNVITEKVSGISGYDYRVSTVTSSSIERYGGWFNTFFGGGAHFKARIVSSSTYLSIEDTIISCTNSAAITVTLPSNPYVGKFLILKKCNAQVNLEGNGKSFYTNASQGTSMQLTAGQNGRARIFWYDGQYWQEGAFN